MNDLEQQKMQDVFSRAVSAAALHFISGIPTIESLIEEGQHIDRIEIVLAYEKPDSINISVTPAK